LINVVLARLVAVQRAEIATLKAVGYPDMAIGLHFLELVGLVTLIGAVLGLVVGAWLGQGLIDLYRPYFHFPGMSWRVAPADVAVSLVVTAGAAVFGALGAVRGVVRLPPAEAMRAPTPPVWRRGWIDRVRIDRLFGQAGQMVLRESRRHPIRLGFSALGIALSVAILVVGRFNLDAVEILIQRQFRTAFRADLSVAFRDAVPMDDARALGVLQGVERVEVLRIVPVRIWAANRWRDIAVTGYPDDGRLRRVVDESGDPVTLPEAGLAMTRKLGEVLGVQVGDRVRLEVRSGERRTVESTVSMLVDELLGIQVHMRADALARLLRESPRASLALLDVDPIFRTSILRRLRALPSVASVDATDEMVDRFRSHIDENIGVMSTIIVVFASVLSVGIVYNNARVALSQRGRDLASLRVLGFTRGEISAVLLGEMAIQVLIGVPVGIVIGRALAIAIASTVDPERFRFPVVVSAQTIAYATGVTLLAALASALLVRRRLDNLDLIAVLKTRE
jgi:putative ABC transport system permease protein